jgi:glutathione S-transferase
MIKLYQFEPAFGLPNASPFCMKLETYLRMAGVPFQIAPPNMQDLRKAPKGKMPFIDDNGKIIADSTFIIDYLKTTYINNNGGDKLDNWLSAEQKAVALGFQRLMEENLYWVMVHTRWLEPTGWAVIKTVFFDKMPAPFRWFVPALARRGLIKAMHGHGIGRHSPAEIHEIGKRDITAIAEFLGNKPYFMGEQPSTIDATVYAFAANLVYVPIASPLKTQAEKYPQLKAYCERIKALYYA